MPQQFRTELSQQAISGRDVHVLGLIGSLDNSSADILNGVFTEILAGGGEHFVLNLAQMDGISSGGLLQLLRIREGTRRAGGTLKLAAPRRRIMEDVLTPFGFALLFDVYGTTEEALHSVGQ